MGGGGRHPQGTPSRSLLTVPLVPARRVQKCLAVVQQELVLRVWRCPQQQGQQSPAVDHPAGGSGGVRAAGQGPWDHYPIPWLRAASPLQKSPSAQSSLMSGAFASGCCPPPPPTLITNADHAAETSTRTSASLPCRPGRPVSLRAVHPPAPHHREGNAALSRPAPGAHVPPSLLHSGHCLRPTVRLHPAQGHPGGSTRFPVSTPSPAILIGSHRPARLAPQRRAHLLRDATHVCASSRLAHHPLPGDPVLKTGARDTGPRTALTAGGS